MHLIVIGLAGFAGAVSRYLLDRWVTASVRGAFPWGTLAVNLTGSLLIGVLYAVAVERGLLPTQMRAPLMIGFIGAYTTFSTLTLESLHLLEGGAWIPAAANLGGSVLLGMAMVFVGVSLGRLL